MCEGDTLQGRIPLVPWTNEQIGPGSQLGNITDEPSRQEGANKQGGLATKQYSGKGEQAQRTVRGRATASEVP